MDATTAPHLIPPEMPQYGEDYHIFELMQNLLEQLLIHQPEDPIPFMIEHLQRNNDNVPKIVILGPPASGKTTIAMWLCKHLNSNLVTKENLIEREISHLMEAARKHLETSKISNTLLVNLVKERLTENDCLRRGWILDGIPETREQVLMMQTLGLVPRHVIVLNAPDMVLIERNVGKRIDPVTGEIYHTTFDWPPEPEIQNRLIEPKGISELETAQKLLDYHRNIIRILPSYPKILKTISADQPCVDVFYQALTYVQTSQRCNAPFTPKVLLCGPSGSGKSLQATLLAQKYGLVNETPPIKHAHIPKNWSLFQPSLLTPSEALLSLLPSEVLCGLAVWGPRLLHNRHLLLFYLLQLARFPQPGQTISAPEEDSSVCTVPINILPGREENIEISSAGRCQGGLGVQQDNGLGKRIWKN